jgi:DNA-binding beta-propeller fold protein YncE
MSLEPRGFIALPEHHGEGGFDHAAVHGASGRLYLAHTANDAVDIIDLRTDRYLRSITGLRGVAGVLVSDERNLVFTSNRGENTVSIFEDGKDADAGKVKVGVHPNGLAFAPSRGLLLAANVGDPKIPGSTTVSLVDIASRTMIASVPVAGRTRWPLYDDKTRAFYVNIRDPPQIAVIDIPHPDQVARTLPIPATGPHGLDLDATRGRLFCACDDGRLIVLNRSSGETLDERPLSGPPDVVFLNSHRNHLYVAIGDPGVIDVFDTQTLERIESCPTEKGAHTIGVDAARDRVYAFLPESHRAAVFEDAEHG